MKAVILAGGFGTRLAEYTGTIAKPMLEVGGKPLIWHIMQHFARYGHSEFLVAAGYKSATIKQYFIDYFALNGDLTVDLASGEVISQQRKQTDWKVTVVDTGEKTMTGGRLLRLRPLLGDEPFLLTYGDGVADVDIDALIHFHKEHGKLVTVTAVRPPARFGELMIENSRVESFAEKPQLAEGWINGGFFVISPAFFDFIADDSTMLERQPLEKAASLGELMAFKHYGFWQCMDTKRDRELLEELWNNGPPWVV